MKAVELAKTYNPRDFEDRIYDFWRAEGCFEPKGNPQRKPYVIVIPPPNVTGVLHMGHGLNNSLQDIVIRFHRMLGDPALWVPGTDHAGIATQNVVERRLRARGIDRRELGREKFTEETWKVALEHKATIIRQLQKIGSSCDWSRERFTLDEGLSRAVREVFVTLYERGLIYKGNYLVNWCSSCGTALSDDEVEHQEVHGKMYHIRYPFEDGSGFAEIATTRPETLLGDTAVAVNPLDERYKGLVGRRVTLPLTGRTIPVIADSYVDMSFGTGVVKITPAHDPNDWEIGNRHNLERINILTPEGKLSAAVPEKYRGMDVKSAREAVVQDLIEAGLYAGDREHVHQVGHCYRCGTVIEPFLSAQWFVRMRGMADKALAAWRGGKIIFFPRKWENTYVHWLENIRDWCVSRQLWWGHRIPVWTCASCGQTMVLRDDPAACTKCGSSDIRQDEDVLDTWFSSWLWPFSTLGWPEKTADLARFYPTSALVTGYDIIFFWVSRMIMAGLEFMGDVPFRDIYITGLVRDLQGRKMSKSLGNGIDPLEIVGEFGADAMRFTLAFLAAQGQDVLVGKESFGVGSRFANKLWNASRYLLMNLEGRELLDLADVKLGDIDKWIVHRLNETAKTVNEALQNYRFNEAASSCYEFFWNEFCDWYIESTKLSLKSEDGEEKDRAVTLLVSLLEETLRLLHPLLPFITEEIYQKLPGRKVAACAAAAFPLYAENRRYPEEAAAYAVLQELVRGVRTLRSEFTIPPDKRIRVAVKADSGFFACGFLGRHVELLRLLMGASDVRVSAAAPQEGGSIALVGTGFEAFVFIRDVIDVPREIERLKKEIRKAEEYSAQTAKKLSSEGFLSKARPEVIAGQRAKKEETDRRIAKMTEYLADLA
ncbi:MAG: valine--tRNA ligase [Spirochaetales bacterium]|jgi:valyl-tRNA synthetase|nr:valine--tRNA ligase [Spirochaetales bacterium]